MEDNDLSLDNDQLLSEIKNKQKDDDDNCVFLFAGGVVIVGVVFIVVSLVAKGIYKQESKQGEEGKTEKTDSEEQIQGSDGDVAQEEEGNKSKFVRNAVVGSSLGVLALGGAAALRAKSRQGKDGSKGASNEKGPYMFLKEKNVPKAKAAASENSEQNNLGQDSGIPSSFKNLEAESKESKVDALDSDLGKEIAKSDDAKKDDNSAEKQEAGA